LHRTQKTVIIPLSLGVKSHATETELYERC